MTEIRIYLLSPEGLALKAIIIEGNRTWTGIHRAIQKEFVVDPLEKTNQAINELISKNLIILDVESQAFYKPINDQFVKAFTDFYLEIESKPHQEKRNKPFVFLP